MKNQIEIVKAIAESMEGIGGVPTNADFYEEFNFRLKSALKIPFDVGRSEELVCPHCSQLEPCAGNSPETCYHPKVC